MNSNKDDTRNPMARKIVREGTNGLAHLLRRIAFE